MKNKTLIWLIMVGMAIAYFGIRYRNPVLIFLILGSLGVIGIFGGMQMILTRRADMPASDDLNARKERSVGHLAQLYGILFTLFGIISVMIALALTFQKPTSESWINVSLSDSQGMGLFLSGAGLLIGIFGVIRLMAGNDAYRETKPSPFESATDGIYFSFFGISLLAIGMWIAFSPASLRIVWESVSSFFQKYGPD